MGEFDSDPSARQNDERDELLAELDALLDRQRVSEGMTLEQRQMVKKYVVEHEGEIEWLREQCRKLEYGSMSPRMPRNGLKPSLRWSAKARRRNRSQAAEQLCRELSDGVRYGEVANRYIIRLWAIRPQTHTRSAIKYDGSIQEYHHGLGVDSISPRGTYRGVARPTISAIDPIQSTFGVGSMRCFRVRKSTVITALVTPRHRADQSSAVVKTSAFPRKNTPLLSRCQCQQGTRTVSIPAILRACEPERLLPVLCLQTAQHRTRRSLQSSGTPAEHLRLHATREPYLHSVANSVDKTKTHRWMLRQHRQIATWRRGERDPHQARYSNLSLSATAIAEISRN